MPQQHRVELPVETGSKEDWVPVSLATLMSIQRVQRLSKRSALLGECGKSGAGKESLEPASGPVIQAGKSPWNDVKRRA